MTGKAQSAAGTRSKRSVLAAETSEKLVELSAGIRSERKRASGRGTSAMLVGPESETTLAVTVIAQELGVEVLRVDLSKVVSKFIGETEKNLDAAFHQAEERGALLLFDEADALFGKRTEVRDSHDRFANANALVQRLEQFGGVAVLAARKRTNLDPPFVRRFAFSLELGAQRRKAG